MNHRKAMPANGTKFSASATVFARVRSQAPASSGLAGTENRRSTKLVISRTEKRMPAMAAARGALKCAEVKVSSVGITSSWECIERNGSSRPGHGTVRGFRLTARQA